MLPPNVELAPTCAQVELVLPPQGFALLLQCVQLLTQKGDRVLPLPLGQVGEHSLLEGWAQLHPEPEAARLAAARPGAAARSDNLLPS